MGSKLEELRAVFQREYWRSKDAGSDFCMAEAKMEVTSESGIKGYEKVKLKLNAEPDELQQNIEYLYYGRWEEHETYGKSFSVHTFVRAIPHSRAGVVRYLQDCNGIGPVTAQSLWEKFAGDAVRILRESPEIASTAVRGLKLEIAQAAAKRLDTLKAMEDCTLRMTDLLGGEKFPKSTIREAIAAWGNRAPEIISRNPYKLMRFSGCGWAKTDALYMKLGLPPNSIKRQALAAWHAVAENRDGHTWVPLETAVNGIKAKIAGATIDTDRAIAIACRSKMLHLHTDSDGNVWVSDSRRSNHEKHYSSLVIEHASHPVAWPSVIDTDLSDHQKDRVTFALSKSVSILGGGPGTGKTHTSARIIGEAVKHFGWGAVGVGAPTNKAALRLTEFLREKQIPVAATSIHRMLGVSSSDDGKGGWSFVHDHDNPLPYKFVILDESSMIDASLMASLLDAIKPGTMVLFVGDTNQLPPVGHGAPLRDLIKFGIPYGELTEVRRNSGSGVLACHDIRQGKSFKTDSELNPMEGKNLKLISCPSSRSLDRIVQLITNIRDAEFLDAKGRKIDAIDDIQVIVAVNKKSKLSRKEVNKRLQLELNPSGKASFNGKFRVGDKIVCLKNRTFSIVPAPRSVDISDDDYDDIYDGFIESDDGPEAFVANGEQGRVAEIDGRRMTVRINSPTRYIKVMLGKPVEDKGNGKESDQADSEDDTGCDWDLAYAISCHRAQGSQWQVVIVALDDHSGATGTYGICKREWLFTAISRFQFVCLLVGQMQTALVQIRSTALAGRKTFAVERMEALASGVPFDRNQPAIAGTSHQIHGGTAAAV